MALALWAVLGPGPASAAVPATPPRAPLASTWTTAQGSWAVVAMGRLREPLDTFWQMFFRPATGTRWLLVTPPGVADNGGLVADDSSGSTVTAGFEPTQQLTFSPVAQTSNEGKAWSPGLLPSGLLPVPDAVATASDGSALALVKAGGGSLVRSEGSLSRWRTLTRRSSLAGTSAGRACGLVALGAVVVAAGEPELGASCTKPGVVGVFALSAGSWRSTGVRLPGKARSLTTSVLRLQSGSSGTSGLVEAGLGSKATLFVIWRGSPSASWSLSSPLRLKGHLVATGFGPSRSVVVVTGGSTRADGVETIAGPGAAWRALPTPPKGTAAVLASPSGTFDALVVASTDFVDWRLDPAGVRWLRTQKLSVPIQFGSSQ